MSWVLIGGFSIAVAFILMQLFKYFVTAPELAAQEATKKKNAKKTPQQPQQQQPQKIKTPKEPSKTHESSEPAQESKKAKQPAAQSPAVASPALGQPSEAAKSAKAPKNKKDKQLGSSSELKAAVSSGNEGTDPEKAPKKQQKGKKPEKAPKKEKAPRPTELATEMTDEDLSRQWAADYTPVVSAKAETNPNPVTPEPWKQVGSNDNQVEELKKKLKDVETELTTSRETNKNAHEKHQEALSKATRDLKTTQDQHLATIARLQRELDNVSAGGLSTNDALRSKDYSKVEKPRAAAPAASLSSLMVEEQKQKEKGKEKEKETKEREERERKDREREERDSQKDKEREERESQKDKEVERNKQEHGKQNAELNKRIADLEANHRELAEQLNASETVNKFLTATIAAEANKPASQPQAAAKSDESAGLKKKVDELTQQLSKRDKDNKDLEEKLQAASAQHSDHVADSKVAADTHKQSLTDANAQIDKLRAQLTALEESSAKGSGNEEAIKQLQQSLQEEKEKTDAAQQQFELAEAAKVSYQGKVEDAKKATSDLQAKFDALKKTHEDLESSSAQAKSSANDESAANIKTLESELAAAKAAHGEEVLKHAQILDGEAKRAKDAEAALATEKAAHESTRQTVSQLEADAKLVEETKTQVADAVKRAEEANTRTHEATARADEATKRVDEAAKNIQDLTNELTNLKKKYEDAEARAAAHESSKTNDEELERKRTEETATLRADFEKKLHSAEENVDTYKKQAEEAQSLLTEEKEARAEVVARLEILSTRVKELEAQPQAGGAAGLKLHITSPPRLASDAPEQQ